MNYCSWFSWETFFYPPISLLSPSLFNFVFDNTDLQLIPVPCFVVVVVVVVVESTAPEVKMDLASKDEYVYDFYYPTDNLGPLGDM